MTLGQTGMGKTKLTLETIFRSLENDSPCCYIDPKGTDYPVILATLEQTKWGQEIWKKRKKRIRFINPVSKSNYLMGFNAIDEMKDFPHAEVDKIALNANSMMAYMLRQSGFEMNEANRMQNVLSAAIGTLIEGGHGKLTLAELPFLFIPYYEGKKASTYNPIVTRLLEEVDHPGTKAFWEYQWQTWNPQARRDWVQSTLGRVFQYLFDERFMMTTCTTENATLDFNEAVEKGYWLFVNLPYHALSEPITTLLGCLIINKIYYASMQVNNPGYRLIIDEARFFSAGPLDKILETSRAFNLWLTLIVQNLDQLKRPTSSGFDFHLRDTALNNVSHLYVFRDNPDAELLSNMFFTPTGRVRTGNRNNGDPDYLPVSVEEEDLKNRIKHLPARQVIIYQKNKPQGVTKKPTPTLEIPDDKSIDQSDVDYFEAKHLQIYGRPAVEIRREITKRQTKLNKLLQPDRPTRRVNFGEEL